MDFRNQSCSWSFHYKNNPLHLYRPIISYRVTDHGPFFKQESFSLSSVLPKKPLCKLVNMHYKEWKSLAPSIFSYICCGFLGRGFFFIPFRLGWERYTCTHSWFGLPMFSLLGVKLYRKDLSTFKSISRISFYIL